MDSIERNWGKVKSTHGFLHQVAAKRPPKYMLSTTGHTTKSFQLGYSRHVHIWKLILYVFSIPDEQLIGGD